MESEVNKNQHELTPSIMKNIEAVALEIQKLEKELNDKLFILLEGFAQGCGLQEGETWQLSEDRKYIILNKKTEKEIVNE